MEMVNSFSDKVLARFADNITDRVFLMIQTDRELMQEYLALIDRKNTSGVDHDTLRRQLGKAIKDKFNLDNLDECKKPESFLIGKYTRHIPK
jgi:hypothetical protein